MLGADGDCGGRSGGGAGGIVEAVADVRDTFRELVVAAASLGVVVPCAPEGAGKERKAIKSCVKGHMVIGGCRQSSIGVCGTFYAGIFFSRIFSAG